MGNKHIYTEFHTGAEYGFRNIKSIGILKSRLQEIISDLPEDDEIEIDSLDFQEYSLRISFFDPSPGESREVQD